MMAKRFSIKVIGKATQLLGIQITQSVKGIRISQEAYIRRTLDDMGMTSCRPAHIPAAGGEVTAAIQRAGNNELIDTTHFRHIIGKLMYAAVGTRPDISYTVAFLGRYLADLTMHHFSMANISYDISSQLQDIHSFTLTHKEQSK